VRANHLETRYRVKARWANPGTAEGSHLIHNGRRWFP
jgi:hypothetical protein